MNKSFITRNAEDVLVNDTVFICGKWVKVIDVTYINNHPFHLYQFKLDSFADVICIPSNWEVKIKKVSGMYSNNLSQFEEDIKFRLNKLLENI